jgi:hypothetical protein
MTPPYGRQARFDELATCLDLWPGLIRCAAGPGDLGESLSPSVDRGFRSTGSLAQGPFGLAFAETQQFEISA